MKAFQALIPHAASSIKQCAENRDAPAR